MIVCLNIALPISYFFLVGIYGKAFFSDRIWAKKLKTPFLLFVLCLHGTFLVLRTIAYAHFPVTTVFEVFSLLSFGIAVTYFVIELRAQHKETGYFILTIAFFFQFISSLFIRNTTLLPPVLESPLFILHVASAIIGYGAITIAGTYGFLYLMLYSEMKATRFGVVYRKLPPLETIQAMAHRALKLVFMFLGLAIFFGTIWLCETYGKTYLADPKFIGTLVLWLAYASILFAFRHSLLKGRTLMILAVVGFFCAVASMFITNFILTTFHAFH